MIDGTTVIDADGHLHDWHVDWAARFPPELADQAPRFVRDEFGFPHLELDGRLLPGGKRRPTVEADHSSLRSDRYWVPNRPGEADPLLRLPDMDTMGIDVAVLFGGHAFLVASMTDSPVLAAATLRAYNEHLAEYCAAAPDRLRGAAMVALQNPSAAAEELARCVTEHGMVAACVPPHHIDGTTLDDPALDPIWAAAQELNVPVCVHTIGAQINPARYLLDRPLLPHAFGSVSSIMALGHVIVGGVLDRFPDLTVAFLEVGAGWVPYAADRLAGADEMFATNTTRLPRKIDEYLASGQLYFAADPDERLLQDVAAIVGEDHLVIGSDYCHPEGRCPFTMRELAEREDLSPGLRHKILAENPARLYRLTV